MQGILVFQTLDEALAQGFEILDRTADGFLVRKRTPYGFALAIVKVSMN